MNSSQFWRKDIFAFVNIGCGIFVLLTILAMFFYPGGTFTDFNSHGYSFFQNFFSELGMVRTHNGNPKSISLILFLIAMFLSGSGMMAFFAAFPQFFQKTRANRTLSLVGSALGIISGVCFIGVAAVPADVDMELHKDFVLWAFRLFPVAVLCYTIVLFRQKTYPRQYAWELVIFLGLLIGYILLLELGPDIKSYEGMVIQAVGQKIIVYASIFSVMIQGWGASRHQGATTNS